MTIALDRRQPKVDDDSPYQSDVEIVVDLANSLSKTVQERDQVAGLPHHEIRSLKAAQLLPLVVPQSYGGSGANWSTAMDIIKALAKTDSSAAQLYGYHLLLSAVPHLMGTADQAAHYYRKTASQNLFWANAINTRDMRLTLTADGKGFRANGIKTFCTGAAVADVIICAAAQAGNPLPVMFVLPTDRPGLTYNHDWDTLGQRRTASGSFTFNHVKVAPGEILGPPPNLESAFPTVLGVAGMLVQASICLGIAEGALETALDYTQTKTRPWETATVDKATDDPYLLHRYGDLWMQLQGAIALTHKATDQFQCAWDKEQALTHGERGAVSTTAAAARASAIQSGLKITSQMFDLMGARAVAKRYGYDLYWRNIRTLSLHDPMDYKLFDIGNWVVNGTCPEPSSYA